MQQAVDPNVFRCGVPKIDSVTIDTQNSQLKLRILNPLPPPDEIVSYCYKFYVGTKSIVNSKKMSTMDPSIQDLTYCTTDRADAVSTLQTDCEDSFFTKSDRHHDTIHESTKGVFPPEIGVCRPNDNVKGWETLKYDGGATSSGDTACSFSPLIWSLDIDTDWYLQHQQALGITRDFQGGVTVYSIPVVFEERVQKKVDGRTSIRQMHQHFELVHQDNTMASISLIDTKLYSYEKFSFTDVKTQNALEIGTHSFRTQFKVTSFILGTDALPSLSNAILLDQSPRYLRVIIRLKNQDVVFTGQAPSIDGVYESLDSTTCYVPYNTGYVQGRFSNPIVVSSAQINGQFDSSRTGAFYSQNATFYCSYHIGVVGTDNTIQPYVPGTELSLDMIAEYEYRLVNVNGVVLSDPFTTHVTSSPIKYFAPATTNIQAILPLSMNIYPITSNEIRNQKIDSITWTPQIVKDAFKDIDTATGPIAQTVFSEYDEICVATYFSEPSTRDAWRLKPILLAVMMRKSDEGNRNFSKIAQDENKQISDSGTISDVCNIRTTLDAGNMHSLSVFHFDSALAKDVQLDAGLASYLQGVPTTSTESWWNDGSQYHINQELRNVITVNQNYASADGPDNMVLFPMKLSIASKQSELPMDGIVATVCSVNVAESAGSSETSETGRKLLISTRSSSSTAQSAEKTILITKPSRVESSMRLRESIARNDGNHSSNGSTPSSPPPPLPSSTLVPPPLPSPPAPPPSTSQDDSDVQIDVSDDDDKYLSQAALISMIVLFSFLIVAFVVGLVIFLPRKQAKRGKTDV